jgi:hypothetical protein
MGAYDDLDKFQTEDGRKIVSAFMAEALADEHQRAEVTDGEQVQDGAVGRLRAAVDDEADVLRAMWELFPKLRDDLRAVLAERDALAARVVGMPAELDMCTCGESRKVCELRTELDQARAQLNAALTEREADTRAVAEACAGVMDGTPPQPVRHEYAVQRLHARFADRIAALDDDEDPKEIFATLDAAVENGTAGYTVLPPGANADGGAQ